MATYSEYKDSGQAWLGAIPSHWSVDKISAHFQERKTTVSDIDYPPLSVTKNGVVPQLESAAKSDNGDNRKLVKCGDFVANSRSDRKGSCGFSSLDGSVSIIYIVATPVDVNGQYFHYLFRSNDYVEEFYRNGHGIVADLWTTRYDEMKNIQIPIPPEEEQKAIVEYLDKVTAEIDKAIEAKERIILALEERRKIIITEAVTRGISPNVPLRDSGIDWLGQIPAHWKVLPLKRIAKLILGKMLDNSGGESSSKIYSYICAKDVHFNGVDTTDLKKMYFSDAEIKRYCVRNGDLLVVEGGAGAGGCAIAKGIQNKIGIQNSIITVRASGRADNEYLSYILQSYVRRGYIEFSCNKATIPHFTKDKIGTVPIGLPTLQEQKNIVAYLKSKERPIDSAIEQQKRLIQLLRERKNIIINEVVTGHRVPVSAVRACSGTAERSHDCTK